MGVQRHELGEARWAWVAPLWPGKGGDPGRGRTDNRLFVSGVPWR